MGLKLYYDTMSQPSRATLLFLKVNSIPFEAVAVTLRNGEQKKPGFLHVNPRGKVPTIDHDGFILTESVAILKYLARWFPWVPDHWYPKYLRESARVDEFMSWQHLNLRTIISTYFRWKVIQPEFLERKKEFDKLLKDLEEMLSQLENTWVVPNCYINGSRNISIADLLAISELEQLDMAGYDVREKYPRLAEYIIFVKRTLNPHFDVISSAARKICQDMKTKNTNNSRKSKL